MRLYQQIRASIARSAIAAAGVLLFVSGMPRVRFRTDPAGSASARRPVLRQDRRSHAARYAGLD